jgi:serine acetyltransferase
VIFINDGDSGATTKDGSLKGDADWTRERRRVRQRASIGSDAAILGGLTVAEGALIGAGAVVTTHVPAGGNVIGNLAWLLSRKGHPSP